MKPIDNKIYLASKSPRRRELLRQVGMPFEMLLLRDSGTRQVDVSEVVLSNERPEDYVTRISSKKAKAAWDVMMLRKLPMRPILAADTAVVLNDIIYGKPANRDEAHAMLTSLSGQTHQVLTSIAVIYQQQLNELTQVSDVTFAALSTQAIDHYCDTSEPYDKAGSYAIQGNAAQFISHISGSYSGIMGLPLFETVKLLAKAGIILP